MEIRKFVFISHDDKGRSQNHHARMVRISIVRPHDRLIKKHALITLVTLATVWFTQTISAQGLISSQPPPGWTGAWPPMPTVDETMPHPPPVLPSQPPQYPFPRPPEWVLPNYGVIPLSASPVPEPATYSLLALGSLAGWWLRRRKV
jgi:hypothetical protein